MFSEEGSLEEAASYDDFIVRSASGPLFRHFLGRAEARFAHLGQKIKGRPPRWMMIGLIFFGWIRTLIWIQTWPVIEDVQSFTGPPVQGPAKDSPTLSIVCENCKGRSLKAFTDLLGRRRSQWQRRRNSLVSVINRMYYSPPNNTARLMERQVYFRT